MLANGILMGLLYAFAYGLFMALAMHLMHGGEIGRPFNRVKSTDWFAILLTSLLVFGARAMLPYLVDNMLFLSWIGVFAMIGVLIYIGRTWYMNHDDSDMGIPMVLVILATLPVCQVIWASVTTGLILIQSWFFMTLVRVSPWLILIAIIAFIVAEYFFYQSGEWRNEDPEFSSERRVFAWAVLAIALIVMVVLLVTQVDWGTVGQSQYEAPYEELPIEEEPYYYEPEPEPTPATVWYTFYNNYLQSWNDTDDSNDYNFGPNPYVADAGASYYDRDFRTRLLNDPALGAADMAWFDCVMGTRVLGDFYTESRGDWVLAINTAKERFMADRELYNAALDRYFSWLDSAEIETRKEKGLTDQMYMDPHTGSWTPDVIVLKTNEHKGLFLVYRFWVKGVKYEVEYRIECGYQQTNVAERMRIPLGGPQRTHKPRPPKPEPTEKPTKAPKPTKTPKPTATPKPTKAPTPEPTEAPKPTETPKPTEAPTPEPTEAPTPRPTEAPTPKPTEAPTPKPTKDPSQGVQDDLVGKQDNPGPGEFTGTGEGGRQSYVQDPHSSTDGDYGQYQEQIGALEDVQQPPKPKPPAEGTHVDDPGTSTGSADEPTPVQPVVHEADSGDTIDDQPGEAWGGPSD